MRFVMVYLVGQAWHRWIRNRRTENWNKLHTRLKHFLSPCTIDDELCWLILAATRNNGTLAGFDDNVRMSNLFSYKNDKCYYHKVTPLILSLIFILGRLDWPTGPTNFYFFAKFTVKSTNSQWFREFMLLKIWEPTGLIDFHPSVK